MNPICNWSGQDDEILIDFVRNHEPIYNVKSKDYRKTQLKQKWWREIGEVLNKTDFDCSKRWCYIRDYYIRRRAKPGTCGEAAKKRSILLSFLDSLPSSQRNSNSNTFDEIPVDNNVIENTHDDNELTHNPLDITLKIENTDHISDNEETQYEAQELSDNDYDKIDDHIRSNRKRKNNACVQEHLNLITNRNPTNQSDLDETDLFFGSMVKIVKKLPRIMQAQLRMQIGSLVGNAELRSIAGNSPHSSGISPRPSTNDSD